MVLQDQGVRVTSRAHGSIADNDIYRNTVAEMYISSRATPNLSGNVLREGRGKGLEVSSKAAPAVSNNTIAANTSAATTIGKSARVLEPEELNNTTRYTNVVPKQSCIPVRS